MSRWREHPALIFLLSYQYFLWEERRVMFWIHYQTESQVEKESAISVLFYRTLILYLIFLGKNFFKASVIKNNENVAPLYSRSWIMGKNINIISRELFFHCFVLLGLYSQICSLMWGYYLSEFHHEKRKSPPKTESNLQNCKNSLRLTSTRVKENIYLK